MSYGLAPNEVTIRSCLPLMPSSRASKPTTSVKCSLGNPSSSRLLFAGIDGDRPMRILPVSLTLPASKESFLLEDEIMSAVVVRQP